MQESVDCVTVTRRWSVVTVNAGPAPRPREYHSAVVYGTSMYCFGGSYHVLDNSSYFHVTRSQPMNDFLAFDFETRTWTPIYGAGSVPGQRANSPLVVFENSCILFGGHNGRNFLNDAWLFDFGRRSWSRLVTQGPTPTPRANAVALIYSNAMYVFGGTNGTAMNDLHRLSLAPAHRRTWQAVASTWPPPLPRSEPVVALYDSNLIVFGGFNARDRLNDFNQFRLVEDDNAVGASDLVNTSELLRMQAMRMFGVGDYEGADWGYEAAGTGLADLSELMRIACMFTEEEDQFSNEDASRCDELRGQADPTEGLRTRARSRSREEHLRELCSCPIAMDIMTDPVLTPSGVTYERTMIEMHLDRVGAFDPMTKTPLTNTDLYPNRAIKSLIEKHFPDHAR